MGFPVWEVKVKALPVVSIVVPFWGYLIGSILYIWLNQKGTTMESIGIGCWGESLRRISPTFAETSTVLSGS